MRARHTALSDAIANRDGRLARGLVSIWVVLLLAALTGCGGDSRNDRIGSGSVIEDPGPVHVHGLGINPSDGALFIATHTGLFRAAEGEQTAQRVVGRYQDTMGFTVVGPDRFLGSGHPDLREKKLPPYLGLIRSDDAGQTWTPVSLLGKADFHVLEASGRRVVGFGSDFRTRLAIMLRSDDGGRSWSELEPPEALLDLALDPSDPDVMVAAGERSLHRSADGGRTWTSIDAPTGLLAWSAGNALFRVSLDGDVARREDRGAKWRDVGSVDGEPAAFEGAADALYVALHDGVVMISRDGGESWSVRSRPKAITRQ